MDRVPTASGTANLLDILDRVLDKGIVIDAWVRIALVGIDLMRVRQRVVVASMDTHLKYADTVGLTSLAARPQLAAKGPAVGEVVETTRRTIPRVPAPRAAGRR